MLAVSAASATTTVVTPSPRLVADIHKTPVGQSKIEHMAALGDKLYMAATISEVYGDELVVRNADGTYELVSDIREGGDGSSPRHLCAFNGKLYFGAYVPGPRREMWVHDPATNETRMLPEQYAGENFSPEHMTVYDGEMYFGAKGPTDDRYKLWAMDSAEQMRMVFDFPDSTSNDDGGRPSHLAVFRESLYSVARASSSRLSLHSYNKTHGVVEVPGVEGFFYPGALTVHEDKLYFGAADGDGDYELWAYDGVNGAFRVADINPSGSSDPYAMVVFDGKLYFEAEGENVGEEIFVYNGTSIELLADFEAGQDGSFPDDFTVVQGELFFTLDPVDSAELHRLSSSGNIEKLPSVNPTTADSDTTLPVVHNGQVFFGASDGVHGAELWKYNSTHGASMVADFVPGSDGLDPWLMVSHNGKLFFFGIFPGRGWELGSYSEDEGVQWVADLTPWDASTTFNSLCSFGSRLFFAAGPGDSNVELWVHEESGLTYMIRDLWPGRLSSWPRFLSVANETLFFMARGENSNLALFRYSEDDAMDKVLEIGGGDNGLVNSCYSLIYFWI